MKLPVGLLVMDFIGTLLLAAGLMETFQGSGSVLPPAWLFPAHNWVLVGAGLALMLPFIRYQFRQALARKNPEGDKSSADYRRPR